MKNLVWLASYPRSGNTWFRIVLSSLLSEKGNKGDLNQLATGPIANSRQMFDELSGISSSDLSTDEIDNLRPSVYRLLSDKSDVCVYLKTHDSFFNCDSGHAVFPSENTFGCIYLIRNPLDVAVSNAYYFNRSFDEMIDAMNDSNYSLNPASVAFYPILEEKPGTWSQHVTSWMNSGLRTQVIRYEDLISMPFQTFSKALEFIDLQYDEDSLLKAITGASIENLQKSERDFGFREKLQSSKAFFRNGKAGNWKAVLSENQIAKIIHDHKEVMHMFGYLDKDNSITEF